MVTRKRGLGRGLDALLGAGHAPGTAASEADPSAAAQPAAPVDEERLLQGAPGRSRCSAASTSPGKDIEPESLQELADSIKRAGGDAADRGAARSRIANTRSSPGSGAGAPPSWRVSTRSPRWCKRRAPTRPLSPWP